jgi:hypothetical protein
VTALAATSPVPQPHEAVCVVSNDLSNRTLTVRLSDLANGYTRLLWREAWRALNASQEAGYWDHHRTVYASVPDAYQVVHAVTGDAAFGGQLKFSFPANGLPGAPGQENKHRGARCASGQDRPQGLIAQSTDFP